MPTCEYHTEDLRVAFWIEMISNQKVIVLVLFDCLPLKIIQPPDCAHCLLITNVCVCVRESVCVSEQRRECVREVQGGEDP